jgi:hypothetical protein
MSAEALDTAAIRAREQAATPGPWHITTQGGIEADSYTGPGEDAWSIASTRTEGDWFFVTHARTDVPALLDEVDRLRDLNVRAEAILRGYLPETQRLEAEIDRLRKVIEDAPHAHLECTRIGLSCTCWKASAVSAAETGVAL